MDFHRLIVRLYGVIISALFAVMFSSQVLAFAGLYTSAGILLLCLPVFVLAYIAYFRWHGGWLTTIRDNSSVDNSQTILSRSLAAVAITLLLVIFLFRLVAWPLSSVADVIPGDALLYHFVKAVELYRTGTMWDLAIPYGQYPVGYESLLSLSLVLSGTIHLTGVVHAVLLLWLVLTLYLLLCRYTILPRSLLLFVSVALLLIPVFYSQVLIVGKNDVAVSITILAAILHAPLSVREEQQAHIIGLAMVTLLSLSTKTSGLYILVFLWLLVMWMWARSLMQQKSDSMSGMLSYRWLPLLIVLMFPSGLWVIRNYVMMGMFFSPEIASFFQGSVFANLLESDLYTSGSESLIFPGFTGVTLVMMGLTIRRGRGRIALLLAIMWFSFIVTPLSAFHTMEKHTLHIEWRYAFHAFLFIPLLVLAVFEGWIQQLYLIIVQHPVMRRTAAFLLVAGSVVLIAVIGVDDLFGLKSERVRQLYEPYRMSVGVNGYESVFDYVRQEISNATIQYTRTRAFYLYDPDYTSEIREVVPLPLGLPELAQDFDPDYFVIRTRDTLEDLFIGVRAHYQLDDWQLIYEDERNRLYERVR